DAWSTDRGEFVGGNAVAAHQWRLHALIAHLPHDEAAFGVETAPIDQVCARLLDLGHQCRKILVAGVDAFIKNFLHSTLVDRFLGFVCKTFAIGGLVVNDGDLLALEMLDDVFAGDLPLLVVAAANAEDVPHLAFGHRGVRRGGSDLENAVLLINFRPGDGDAPILLPHHSITTPPPNFLSSPHP